MNQKNTIQLMNIANVFLGHLHVSLLMLMLTLNMILNHVQVCECSLTVVVELLTHFHLVWSGYIMTEK